MKYHLVEQVYETMSGLLLDEYCVPGVKNEFAEGMPCERLYRDVQDAYARLRNRLGTADEDADVEIIINAFLEMERILCCRMFEYGVDLSQQFKKTP